MKKLLFSLAAFGALTFMSCGDSGCDSDLSGTYTGTITCSGVETDATVTISGSDGDYSVSGEYNESSPEQDGCMIKWSNTILGLGQEIELTFDGNTLTLVERENASDVTICEFVGTK